MESLRIAVISNSTTDLAFTTSLSTDESNVVNYITPQNALDSNVLTRFDIVTMDVEVLGDDLFSIVNTVTQTSPHTKLIAVFHKVDAELARTLMKRGVTGLMLRQEWRKNLSSTIQTVRSGRIVVSADILKSLVPPRLSSA